MRSLTEFLLSIPSSQGSFLWDAKSPLEFPVKREGYAKIPKDRSTTKRGSHKEGEFRANVLNRHFITWKVIRNETTVTEGCSGMLRNVLELTMRRKRIRRGSIPHHWTCSLAFTARMNLGLFSGARGCSIALLKDNQERKENIS